MYILYIFFVLIYFKYSEEFSVVVVIKVIIINVFNEM